MMLYLLKNTRPDISFSVHACTQFTHNTKVSYDMYVKRICQYLQDTKDKGLLFNPFKKLVVDCYTGKDFAELWGHVYTQYPICDSSRSIFVITFINCPLFWVENNIDRYVSLYSKL